MEKCIIKAVDHFVSTSFISSIVAQEAFSQGNNFYKNDTYAIQCNTIESLIVHRSVDFLASMEDKERGKSSLSYLSARSLVPFQISAMVIPSIIAKKSNGRLSIRLDRSAGIAWFCTHLFPFLCF